MGPVVVIDCLPGFSPLCEESHHVFVVLVVGGGQISDVSITLGVVEVNLPFWSVCLEVLVCSWSTLDVKISKNGTLQELKLSVELFNI